jgi:aminoglycoside 6-adenylyltransferase
MPNSVLQKVKAWGDQSNLIRAILLIGSRGSVEGPKDEFSDYDLSVFVTKVEAFVKDESWIATFGEVLLMLPEQGELFGMKFPARLIIFEDGTRIDFTFFDAGLLRQMASDLDFPRWMQLGHRVLIDKDGVAQHLPQKPPTPTPPDEVEYQALINEFFWESTYVAKYLYREDIWPAKFSEWLMKDQLLMNMLAWSAQARHRWQINIGYMGRGLQQWLSPTHFDQLESTFTGFDIEDNWRALKILIALFRKTAMEVGTNLGYDYPQKLEDGVLNHIEERTGRKL